MVFDVDGEWLSVSAAARRVGLSRQAIQQRIKRGTVESRLDNRGNPLVRVQDSVSGASSLAALTKGEPVVAGERLAASLQVQAASEPKIGESDALSALQEAHRETIAVVERSHAAEVARLRADIRLSNGMALAVFAAGVAVLALCGPWWRGW